MTPKLLGGRRILGLIALAVVFAVLASQIVLVLTAGRLGIPGLFTAALTDSAEKDVALRDPQTPKPKTRKSPPPIATPAPSSKAVPVASPAPETGEDAEPEPKSASPVSQPDDGAEQAATDAKPTPAEPQDSEEDQTAKADDAVPSTGPVGWQGPDGAPGSQPETESGEAPSLDGSINLDVGDALTDLNREKAEEEKAAEDKKNGKGETKGAEDSTEDGKRKSSASASSPEAGNGAGGRREVLPWDAIVPDAELLAPVDVPENTPEFSLPTSRTVEEWLKGRATNLADGGTRYELWLELPNDMRLRLNAVGYQFQNPPAPTITKMSRRSESGFRVEFEGPGCKGRITITLTYRDSRSQKVIVDGCGVFG